MFPGILPVKSQIFLLQPWNSSWIRWSQPFLEQFLVDGVNISTPPPAFSRASWMLHACEGRWSRGCGLQPLSFCGSPLLSMNLSLTSTPGNPYDRRAEIGSYPQLVFEITYPLIEIKTDVKKLFAYRYEFRDRRRFEGFPVWKFGSDIHTSISYRANAIAN